MKRLLFLLIFVISSFYLYANIPKEDFIVIDNTNSNVIKLGNKLSVIFDIYPTILLKGERKYSNITLREYQGNGIIFSISAFAKSEKDANVRRIEVISSIYSTKRGIFVGSTKNDVIMKYGVPDYVQNDTYYYYNKEDDVLELKFYFNKNDLLTSIVLSAGT
jgi:hypothetical protein